MKSKEIRIPKDDWGQFCWECYLRGFPIITGRMTEDGEVIVTSGVPKLRAEEFAENIRFANKVKLAATWKFVEHGRLNDLEVIERGEENGSERADES